jgi:tellurite resistance protein TerC
VTDTVAYSIFGVVIAGLLALDLLVVHRRARVVSLKEAASWSVIWIGVALAFGVFVVGRHGDGALTTFLTGYSVEKALSIDNVFLFVLIFTAFAVPRELQRRVLFYGVVGAIVMRVLVIMAGAALVERFAWILYAAGAFLVYAAVKLWRDRFDDPDLSHSTVMQRVQRVIPTTDGFRGERFVVRENGRLLATPLFTVLVVVELTDIVLALDALPAMLSVTNDRFILITANVFALLGLRSLYFLLDAVAHRLTYLKAGVAVILGFIGLKLLTENIAGIYHVSTLQSLVIIGVVLVVSVIASLRDVEEDEAMTDGMRGVER